MFIDKILDTLLRPFREIYSKWMGVKSIQGGILGDVRRVQQVGNQAVGYGQQGVNFVQGAPGQVQQGIQGAQQQFGGNPGSQEKKKMSWWPWSKKTCARCNNKLDKSWDACPFCGLGAGAGLFVNQRVSLVVDRLTFTANRAMLLCPRFETNTNLPEGCTRVSAVLLPGVAWGSVLSV